jgi:hypothetical protein
MATDWSVFALPGDVRLDEIDGDSSVLPRCESALAKEVDDAVDAASSSPYVPSAEMDEGKA